MSERKVMFENIPLEQWYEEDRMGVIVQRMSADRPFILSVPNEREKHAHLTAESNRMASGGQRFE
ncbi:hypothetical protein EU546_01815 [Candidatus Thorarchaeota archaeon]|nr:MAG: hypothetical protein EU546_01815 [Candidatus Thorarchaeota archaeon]